MIISGLEKLTKEEFDNLDIDYLQLLLLIVSDLYPVKTLGHKVNVSNIVDQEDFSFDLDNGKELIEIKVRAINNAYSIVIYYRNCNFHYIYDTTKKKITISEMYMNINNLLFKHKMFKDECMFELYNYDDCSDITIYFKNGNIDINTFIKEFFIDNTDINNCLDILPKKYLKIQINNPNESRYIEYRNNKLINDVRGDRNGKER